MSPPSRPPPPPRPRPARAARTRASGTGLALLLALASAGCAGPRARPAPAPPPLERFSLPMMGTVIEVALPPGPSAEAAARIVLDTFAEVDARMSEWRPGSPLGRLNAGAGGPALPVPDDVRALIRRGLEIGALTSGAFDISWAALWGLWDFRADPPRLPDPADVAARAPRVPDPAEIAARVARVPDPADIAARVARVPDPAEIAARVARVDYRRVVLDDAAGTVALPAGMVLGLGGIAKGWALDLAARRLREAGHADFMISAGGQVMVGGRHGGEAWTVGLRDPRGGPDDAFALVDLAPAPGEALSLSTSGDYERFFVVDGVRYHHILDPRTGQPARGLRAAAVLSPDATLADALSTALMVLGRERGLALAATLPGVEALVVDDAGAVHRTPGFAFRPIHALRP